jgi:transcriptional regulator with XRE-family HTH domain
MTQETLGQLADLHRTYVSGLEQGTRNPSARVLLQLARALGRDAGELLHGIELD